MNYLPLKAGLVALAMVSVIGAAEAKTKNAPGEVPDVVETKDSTQQINEVRQFLANGKDLERMKLPKLQQRLHRAETLRSVPNLPPELDQALQQEIARISHEIARRDQAGAEPGQPPAQAQAPAGSPEAAAFLQSVRPADQLTLTELRRQMQQATRLSQSEAVSPEQRSALRDVIRQARAGLKSKQDAAQQPAPPPEPPVAAQPAPTPPAEPQAQQPAPVPAPAPAPVPTPPAQADQQPATPTILNPALERQAQAYLNDTTDVSTMKRKQLRKRLSAVRDMLATNQLSPQTREALRQKLARERAVLRNEVATEEGLPPPAAPAPAPSPQQAQPQQAQPQTGSAAPGNVTTSTPDLRRVLQDRRPPGELDDRELVRRIDVYRDVVADDRYDAAQRMMWRRQMEEDRLYLRRQMIEERRLREARLRRGDDQFNRDVEDRYDPGYDVPGDVFAAEADDSELADVLVAPPRRAIDRRYSVDDFERSPQLREAVARIEIDTVHFGFGEGYLREEEVDKLDRIAQVLEKILARHPEEVFLIEGHTDAVGSDQANLALSRQRAMAVKEALTTYYVIPAQNLRTVGLGERYLKIPTNQPEAENRRVSLARITPLVGQAD